MRNDEHDFLSDPDLRPFLDDLRAQGTLDDARRDGVRFDRAHVIGQIECAIASEGIPSPDIRPQTRRPSRFRMAAWLTSGVAVLLLAVGAVQRYAPFASVQPDQTYRTATGERLTVTLADGSRVILAPETELTVSSGFGATTRTLGLRGRAFFHVQPSSTAPFTISARNTSTRVLGTMFDVTAYSGDPYVRVVVQEGKVTTGMPRYPAATLTAGTMALVTDSGAAVSAVAHPSSYTGWTSGTLEFREVPVSDILKELRRWYGVRFTLADTTFAKRRVTAFLDYGNVVDLVAALETVLHVKASVSKTQNDSVILLQPRRTATPNVPERRSVPEHLIPVMEVGR